MPQAARVPAPAVSAAARSRVRRPSAARPLVRLRSQALRTGSGRPSVSSLNAMERASWGRWGVGAPAWAGGYLSPKTVRCQSLRATAVVSNMTCFTWVYSSSEYWDMSLP